MSTKTKDYNFALSQVKLLMKESKVSTDNEHYILAQVKEALLIPQYFENCRLRLEDAFSDGFQPHDIPVIIKIFLTLNYQLTSIQLKLDELKYVFYAVIMLYLFRYDKINDSEENVIKEVVKNATTGKEEELIVDYMDLQMIRIFFNGCYDLITLDPAQFTLVGLQTQVKETARCLC